MRNGGLRTIAGASHTGGADCQVADVEQAQRRLGLRLTCRTPAGTRHPPDRRSWTHARRRHHDTEQRLHQSETRRAALSGFSEYATGERPAAPVPTNFGWPSTNRNSVARSFASSACHVLQDVHPSWPAAGVDPERLRRIRRGQGLQRPGVGADRHHAPGPPARPRRLADPGLPARNFALSCIAMRCQRCWKAPTSPADRHALRPHGRLDLGRLNTRRAAAAPCRSAGPCRSAPPRHDRVCSTDPA
jgi:hypothetical protein